MRDLIWALRMTATRGLHTKKPLTRRETWALVRPRWTRPELWRFPQHDQPR